MYNRQREQGGLVATPYTATYYRHNQSSTQAVAFAAPVGEYKLTRDVVTAHFAQLVNQGTVVNNPFQSYRNTGTVIRGTRTLILNTPPAYTTGVTWKTTRDGNNGVGSNAIRPEIVRADTDRLAALVATRALARIDPSVAGGLLTLAEIRETMDLLRNPLSGAYKLTRALIDSGGLRKKRGAAKRAVNGVSSQYLAYLFGMLPLMQDIEGILKALAELPPPTRHTARAEERMESTYSYTRPYNDGEVKGTIYGSCKYFAIARAGVLYTAKPQIQFDQLGLRLSEVPITAVELIPFEFVLNWFVNVNDIVRALTPQPGVNRLAEWLTLTEGWTTTESLGALSAVPTGWTASGGGDVVTYSAVTKTRIPTNLGAYVSPAFKINPLNVGKLTSLLALLTQAATKGR